jgi:hypothetical protein
MRCKVLPMMIGLSLVLTCAPGINAESVKQPATAAAEMNKKDQANSANEPAAKPEPEKKQETGQAGAGDPREKANAQAKKARNDKVARLRKAKVSSWQLINR